MTRKRISMLVLIAAALLGLRPAMLMGQDEAPPPLSQVAIFTDSAGDPEMKALSGLIMAELSETFRLCGRFYPLERESAATNLQMPPGSGEEAFRKTAAAMKCDLMVLVAVRRNLDTVFAAMKVVPLSGAHGALAREYQFESRVPLIVPAKMAREIARLHRSAPVTAKILSVENGRALIAAGQWHGLAPGEYPLKGGGAITVYNTSRFTSVAGLPAGMSQGGSLLIDIPADDPVIMAELDARMKRTMEQRYTLRPAYGTVEEQFMYSMLFYNLTAGALFPGFGTYLSVDSLVPDYRPGYGGLFLTAGLMFTHLTLTESLTGYETNFFPWIKDGDKTESMHRLHIFLWASIPFTLTASFLDQMAHALAASERTPPFLMTSNETAAALSLFFPGGGLFYKGHRLMGWGYYFTEMFLAGYGAYYWGDGTGYIYACAALGLVKFIEIVHAYVTDVGYGFYRREMDRPVPSYNVTGGMVPVNGRPVYRLGIEVRL